MLLLSLCFVAGCVVQAATYSSTYDEFMAHICGGYYYWMTGRFEGGWNNPPLVQALLAFPPWLSGRPFDPLDATFLFLARLPSIAMGLAIGLLGWWWIRGRLSADAAAVYLMAWTWCPLVSAHSSLATTDVGETFFVFLAMICLWFFIERPLSWWRLVAVASACGTALASKFASIVWMPWFFACVLFHLFRASRARSGWWSFLGALAGRAMLFAAVFLVVFSATFSFDGCLSWERKKPLPPGHERLAGLLRPVEYVLPSAAWNGLKNKFEESLSSPQAVYLFGRTSKGGFWFYYPVVFFFKSPLPFLLFLAAALRFGYVSVVRGKAPVIFGAGRGPAGVLGFVVSPLALFLASTFFNTHQVGLRHMLPAMPLLMLFLACSYESWFRRSFGRRFLAASLLSLQMCSFMGAFPHELSYMNVTAGRVEDHWKVMNNSDLDWGQELGFPDLLLRRVRPEGLRIWCNPRDEHIPFGMVFLSVNYLTHFGFSEGVRFPWCWIVRPDYVSDGGSWLVYVIDEERLRKLAERHDTQRVWNWYLSACRFNHDFRSMLSAARRLEDSVPTARFYEAMALVRLGRFKEGEDMLLELLAACENDMNLRAVLAGEGVDSYQLRVWIGIARQMCKVEALRRQSDARRLGEALLHLAELAFLTDDVSEEDLVESALAESKRLLGGDTDIHRLVRVLLLSRHSCLLPHRDLVDEVLKRFPDHPALREVRERLEYIDSRFTGCGSPEYMAAFWDFAGRVDCPQLGWDWIVKLHAEHPDCYVAAFRLSMFLSLRATGGMYFDTGRGSFLDGVDNWLRCFVPRRRMK